MKRIELYATGATVFSREIGLKFRHMYTFRQ